MAIRSLKGRFEPATAFEWVPVQGGFRCCICLVITDSAENCFGSNGRKIKARLVGCGDDSYHGQMANLNCAVCASCAKRLGITW